MDIRTEMKEKLKLHLIFTPVKELSSLESLTKRSLIQYMLKIQLQS